MKTKRGYYERPIHPLMVKHLLSSSKSPQQSQYIKFKQSQITDICTMKIDDFPIEHQDCLKCLELNIRKKRLYCYEIHQHSPKIQSQKISSSLFKSSTTRDSSDLQRNISISRQNIENRQIMSQVDIKTPYFKPINPCQQKPMSTTNNQRTQNKKSIILPKSIHQLEPIPKLHMQNVFMSFSDKNIYF